MTSHQPSHPGNDKAKWLHIDAWVRAMPADTKTEIINRIVEIMFLDVDIDGTFWNLEKEIGCADAIQEITQVMAARNLVPPSESVRCRS